jgi:adenylate cyclase
MDTTAGPAPGTAVPDGTCPRCGRRHDAVIAFLRSLGADDDRIAAAHRGGFLAGLAGDLVLAEGATRSARDLAEAAGQDVERVLGLWHTLGVSVPGPDVPMFTERDERFIRAILSIETVTRGGDELLRVLGGSMARLAEAAVALYVQTTEPELGVTDGDQQLTWAEALATTTRQALDLGDAMGAVFAHHLRDAIDRQRAAHGDIPDLTLHRYSVGFVDLVGFTPLTRAATPDELIELVTWFEAMAFEIAASHDGRIVKTIGDEVMFVALEPAAACAIARELVALGADGITPRGGVASGQVVTRHGDYYGTVVNLASRLADLAVPGEVLVDTATAEALGAGCQPAGRRMLKGFDEPVAVFTLDG